MIHKKRDELSPSDIHFAHDELHIDFLAVCNVRARHIKNGFSVDRANDGDFNLSNCGTVVAQRMKSVICGKMDVIFAPLVSINLLLDHMAGDGSPRIQQADSLAAININAAVFPLTSTTGNLT